MNLNEVLTDAQNRHVAVGHFNISNLEGLWGIFNGAKSLNLPVVIGVSEGERDFVGVRQTLDLVKSIREEYNYPIFLNADHTYTFDRVKEVVDLGYDSVIVDGANLPIEENINLTKQCVDYVKSTRPEMLIEAEIGYIGKSSGLLSEIPAGATVSTENMPTGEEAKRFVDSTGIGLLSPAVGNIHGMLLNAPNPELNIDRIREIKAAVPETKLVLHGGSGISDQNFKDAIQAGICMIHINTEIRLAFRDAVKKYLDEHPNEVAPYKIMGGSIAAVQEVVTARLKLFNNIQ
jgi:fructose-bisphosphate aldolase class II